MTESCDTSPSTGLQLEPLLLATAEKIQKPAKAGGILYISGSENPDPPQNVMSLKVLESSLADEYPKPSISLHVVSLI